VTSSSTVPNGTSSGSPVGNESDTPSDVPTDLESAVLELNNAHAAELSFLKLDRLRTLLHQAFYARRLGSVEAFLLALNERADYDSPNYLWFRERYSRFVYVDRIVVAGAARGRGHARRLYANLIERAAAAGHDVIVCEVNSDPPNPASDAFHAALGFTEVGTASIHGGAKTVRYLALSLSPARKNGSTAALFIRVAHEEDEAGIVALWQACGLIASYNNPHADFRFARAGATSEVLVAEDGFGRLIGSVMVGHDGHRGWLYYVGSHPTSRSRGVGRELVRAAETWLRGRGVRKAQLLVRQDNPSVVEFYERLGFEQSGAIVMQRWLNSAGGITE